MIFKPECETQVYLNEEGDVVVVQDDGSGNNDPSIVWFSPARARLVAAAMISTADEADALASTAKQQGGAE